MLEKTRKPKIKPIFFREIFFFSKWDVVRFGDWNEKSLQKSIFALTIVTNIMDSLHAALNLSINRRVKLRHKGKQWRSHANFFAMLTKVQIEGFFESWLTL